MRSAPVVLVFLVACSEYTVNGKEQDPAFDTGDPAPTAPELLVDPSVVAETSVCGARTVPVALRNNGDAALSILGLALDGDATAELPATPFSIAPGETVTLSVDVAPGAATLTITSDDPDARTVTVPLSATADAPPSIAILSPAPGDIVDVGTALPLTVQVSDDADAPGDLGLAWTSDVDGALGAPVADATGYATFDWDPSARTAGPHVLTAAATDSCGNVSTTTVDLCQQAGYTEDNLDLATWHFEGVATWDTTNDWLELTSPTTYAVGSAFQTSASVTGDAVSIELQFFTGGGTGADGLALTALDVDRMTGFLGSAGGCLGYGSGDGCTPAYPALPGWTVEVDTYTNGGWDPTTEDHVAFVFDGSMTDLKAWAPLPEMEDTGWHTLSVNVAAPHVRVAVDGVDYIDQDIPGYYTFPAYVGFSAATGGQTNYHLIDALQVTEYACEEE
jgi:hypothetical protein